MAQSLLPQLLDPANRANQYPVFNQLRESGPLRVPDSNLVVFASFAECDEVLRHPSSCCDRLKSTAAQRAIVAGENPRPLGHAGLSVLRPGQR